MQDKLASVCTSYATAAVGLAFYTTRFPERHCVPGRWDLVGASHQFWHVFIFLGMAYWCSITLGPSYRSDKGEGYNVSGGGNGDGRLVGGCGFDDEAMVGVQGILHGAFFGRQEG